MSVSYNAQKNCKNLNTYINKRGNTKWQEQKKECPKEMEVEEEQEQIEEEEDAQQHNAEEKENEKTKIQPKNNL